jgi:hypothetical protein
VLAKKDGSYGKVAERQHVHHAAFLPTGQLVSGGDNGALMLWEKNKALMVIDGHAKGPCKCIKLRGDSKTLLTAGGDGKCIEWAVEKVGEEDLYAGLGEQVRTGGPLPTQGWHTVRRCD